MLQSQQSKETLQEQNQELPESTQNEISNVTTQKRLEEEILKHQEARLEAEKKQKEFERLILQASQLVSIGKMVAGFTQEINQPLSAIQVHADTLLYLIEEKGYHLPSNFHKIFQEIYEGARRIREIIQHLHAFWHSPDNRTFEIIEFNEAIRSALELTNLYAFSQSVKLISQFSSQPICIKADKLLIEQIVINLINSAINTIDLKKSSRKEIIICTRLQDGKAILEVHSNVAGGYKEYLDDLHNNTSLKQEISADMDIGMIIVKTFVDRFRGKMEVAKSQNGGAIFIISFPISERVENQL
jgi:C4-dicarboxylate-specific signal transduction histidine kinase